MPRLYEPGEIVRLKDAKRHYVYELVDDYGVPFYVGKTQDPEARFRAHAALPKPRKHEYQKAERLRAERVRALQDPKMRIVSVHLTADEAVNAERKLMLEHTKPLMNVTSYADSRVEQKQLVAPKSRA